MQNVEYPSLDLNVHRLTCYPAAGLNIFTLEVALSGASCHFTTQSTTCWQRRIAEPTLLIQVFLSTILTSVSCTLLPIRPLTLRHRENRLYKTYKELLRWIPSIRDVPHTDLKDVFRQVGRHLLRLYAGLIKQV